jgi:hypothetical protein
MPSIKDTDAHLEIAWQFDLSTVEAYRRAEQPEGKTACLVETNPEVVRSASLGSHYLLVMQSSFIYAFDAEHVSFGRKGSSAPGVGPSHRAGKGCE